VFEPETLKAMTAAYVEACRSLGLTDRDDPLTRLVPHRIIDAAIEGERDPKRLREHGITTPTAPVSPTFSTQQKK
jgi:hypothetical protein